MRYGIARGLFSNESGLGSAPIVAAAAQTRNPVRQALVSSTGTFWDTVVVCAMTGLVVVNSGDWRQGLRGAALTSAAFAESRAVGPVVLTVGLLTFVFSTILGWSYYGEKAAEYLFGTRAIRAVPLALGGRGDGRLGGDAAGRLVVRRHRQRPDGGAEPRLAARAHRRDRGRDAAPPLGGDALTGYHPRVGRPNLFGMGREALAATLQEMGEPAYRARQLYEWLYRQRVRDVSQMSNLSKDLRGALGKGFCLAWPEVAERRLSFDGTRKYLFRLRDGASVEAVYIPEDERRTICISTQVGCPLRCAFCLTGITGYRRNLEVGEILGQVAWVMEEHPVSDTHPSRQADDAFPWNIVVMGMGEPLLNADATLAALRVLMDEDGFGVPPRKLTLSTVGILPALERLAREPVRPNLAISLHAPEAALRRALMPIETRYPIEAVIAAALDYPVPSGGRVTFEYVLLGGVNDSPGHARQLARRLGGKRAKVNLIPLNPAPAIPFQAPEPEAVDAFAAILGKAGVAVSVRRSRGRDILAACGQLHLEKASASPSAPPP